MTWKNRLAIVAVLSAVLVGGIAQYSKGERSSDLPALNARLAVPVVIAPAETRTLPITFAGIGTVESLKTISVKSRVDGQIDSAPFEEGSEVHNGDLLFKIDPRPIEASLKMAEATLARDQAQLANAKRNLERYSILSKQGYAPKQQLDESTAQVASLEATVRSDMAAVDLAKLQLDFTNIRSPVNGIAGAQLVHAGNLVKANDSALVTIRQVRPIDIAFSLPETLLPQIRAELAAGSVTAKATIPSDTGAPLSGSLTFIDNAVDPATGTIKIKAEFTNDDGRLVTGQFVNISVGIETLDNAVVIPTRAVQAGQKGPFVYVIDKDSRARLRQIEQGATADGMTVIRSGLASGETVVIDGQLRLADGIAVNIRSDATAEAPAPASLARG